MTTNPSPFITMSTAHIYNSHTSHFCANHTCVVYGACHDVCQCDPHFPMHWMSLTIYRTMSCAPWECYNILYSYIMFKRSSNNVTLLGINVHIVYFVLLTLATPFATAVWHTYIWKNRLTAMDVRNDGLYKAMLISAYVGFGVFFVS